MCELAIILDELKDAVLIDIANLLTHRSFRKLGVSYVSAAVSHCSGQLKQDKKKDGNCISKQTADTEVCW